MRVLKIACSSENSNVPAVMSACPGCIFGRLKLPNGPLQSQEPYTSLQTSLMNLDVSAVCVLPWDCGCAGAQARWQRHNSSASGVRRHKEMTTGIIVSRDSLYSHTGYWRRRDEELFLRMHDSRCIDTSGREMQHCADEPSRHM